MSVIFCLNYTDVFQRPSLLRIGLQDGRLFAHVILSFLYVSHTILLSSLHDNDGRSLNSCSLSCSGPQIYLKIFLFINHLSQIIFRFHTPLRVFKLGYIDFIYLFFIFLFF